VAPLKDSTTNPSGNQTLLRFSHLQRHGKRPSITTWDDSPSPNPPTDSAEEALFYEPFLASESKLLVEERKV